MPQKRQWVDFTMNILELIKQDGFTYKKVAATKGGVWKGACPWYGGIVLLLDFLLNYRSLRESM